MIKYFIYLFRNHKYPSYKNGANIILERRGISTFFSDVKNFGLEKTWMELKDLVEFYEKPQLSPRIYFDYLKSLIKHKVLVYQFGKILKVDLWMSVIHDLNKFLPSQFIPYAQFFYGQRTQRVKGEFNKAWRDHLATNKHHWQYWVINEGDGSKTVLDMPEKYIKEMIADWTAANFLYGEKNIFVWFTGQKFYMSDYTFERVTRYITYVLTNIDRFIQISKVTDYRSR